MPQLRQIFVGKESRVALPITKKLSLDLSNVGLKAEGAVVAAWLLSNSWASLSVLNLSQNDLGFEGAEFVYEALKKNVSGPMHAVYAGH